MAAGSGKTRKKSIGINSIVLNSIILYGLILFTLLFILQTVFLNDTYRMIAGYQLYKAEKKACSLIEEAETEEELFDGLRRLREESDARVYLIDRDGEFFFSTGNGPDLPDRSLADELFAGDGSSVKGHGEVEVSRIGDPDKTIELTRVYRAVRVTFQGGEYVLYLSQFISPVNGSIQTIRVELVGAFVVFLGTSILFSMILTANITKPLKEINRSAEKLAEGDYQIASRRKQAREFDELTDTLQYTAERLDRVDQLQKELLANVSHDLRTPLTTITAYAELMRDIPGEKSDENIQVIIEEASNLTNLVNDYLEISKLQAGIEVLNREKFDVRTCIEEVVNRVKRLSGAKEFTFRVTLDEDRVIYADKFKIQQVLYNLVDNAIKFSNTDSTVDISTHLHGDRILVSVADHGVGIEKENINKIWERFYKTDTSRGRDKKGTGLGLSIVREIIQAHKENIDVISTPGVGTEFIFTLPRA